MAELADRSFQGQEVDAKTGQGLDGVLLSLLYLFEASLGLMGITAYQIASNVSFVLFLQGRPGIMFMAAVAGVLSTGAAIGYWYCSVGRALPRMFKMTVVTNLVTVVMLVIIGEGMVRALYRETTTGDMLGGTYLYPREWMKVVAKFNATFRSQLSKAPYHIYDDLLGWTVASSRRGEEGLYFSSAEGLRSKDVGTALAHHSPSTRIALVGDSYTFAEEVPFEASWGHQLELRLGKDFQVLNFGVMGYSIAQAYLRYIKEVRPWHPEMVIFGFIDHDLVRAMGVYSFLTFPRGSTPFATPRFVLADGHLTLLNTPLPSPEKIFSARSITELPYIEYDPAYFAQAWDRSYWRIPNSSYLFRWLESWIPVYKTPGPDVSDVAMKAISLSIFQAFIENVRADGSIPVLGYLPSWLKEPDGTAYDPISVQILRGAGLEYVDLTECLSQVPFAQRVMPRHHYSPQANSVVGSCLRDIVIERLESEKPETRRFLR